MPRSPATLQQITDEIARLDKTAIALHDRGKHREVRVRRGVPAPTSMRSSLPGGTVLARCGSGDPVTFLISITESSLCLEHVHCKPAVEAWVGRDARRRRDRTLI